MTELTAPRLAEPTSKAVRKPLIINMLLKVPLTLALLAWVTPTLQAAIDKGIPHEVATAINTTVQTDPFRKGNKPLPEASHPNTLVTDHSVPLIPVWSNGHRYKSTLSKITIELPVEHKNDTSGSSKPGPGPVIGARTQDLDPGTGQNGSSHVDGPRIPVWTHASRPSTAPLGFPTRPIPIRFRPVLTPQKPVPNPQRSVPIIPQRPSTIPWPPPIPSNRPYPGPFRSHDPNPLKEWMDHKGCPRACERNGHIQSAAHWSRDPKSYHLYNCMLPMLVYHPKTSRTPHVLRRHQRVCTLPDRVDLLTTTTTTTTTTTNKTENFHHHQKTPVAAGCGKPKFTTEVTRTLRITEFEDPLHRDASNTRYIKKHNALLTLMTPYFSSPDNCGKTEVYGYWRYGKPDAKAHDWAVTVGMYKGVGLTAASVDNVARKLFEKNGETRMFDVLEVCDAETEGGDRTVGIKVFPTVKFIPAMEAVNDHWKKGKCMSMPWGTETDDVQVVNAEY